MKRTTCPYLGLKDDPTTALQFPSNGNYCHHARPIAPVRGIHQQKFCLTGDHVACPIYQAARPVPLPPALAAPKASGLQGRQVAALLGIPLLIAAAAAMGMAWNAFGIQLLRPPVVPDTGGGKPVNSGLFNGILGAGTTQTDAAPGILPGGGSAPQQPAPPANCPMPVGWTTYNVNPTDSLFRLSVVYGVSVDTLQQVNCMGDNTVILPGQVIYVPFIPTNTPIPGDPSLFSGNQPSNANPPQINPPSAPRKATNTPQPGAPNNPAVVAPTSTDTSIPVSPNIPASSTPAPSSTTAPTTVPPTTAPSSTPVPPTLPPPTIAPTLPPPPTLAPPPTAAPTLPPPPTLAPPPTIAPTFAPPPTQAPPPTAAPTLAPPPTQAPPPTTAPTSAPAPTDPPPTSAPPPTTAPTSAPAPTQAPPPTSAPAPTDPPPTSAPPPTQAPPPTSAPAPTDPPPTSAPAPTQAPAPTSAPAPTTAPTP